MFNDRYLTLRVTTEHHQPSTQRLGLLFLCSYKTKQNDCMLS